MSRYDRRFLTLEDGERISVHVAYPDALDRPRILVLADSSTSSSGLEQLCCDLAADGFVALAPQLPENTPRSSRNQLQPLVEVLRLDGYGGEAAIVTFGSWSSQIPSLIVWDAVRCAVGFVTAPEAVAIQSSALHKPVQLHVTGTAPSAVLEQSNLHICQYSDAREGFMIPHQEGYHHLASSLARSRLLGLLRPLMGPRFDLARLFQEHLAQEFLHRDATATIATMVHQPYVNHVPTLTGGFGHDMLKRFYKYHFIPTQPNDRRVTLISETVSADTVVLEFINRFTHDAVNDYMLPGLAPTGREIEIPAVVIAKFRGDKLYYEHIYWDQASVLVQLGLLDPTGLPVSGREQARKVFDPSEPSNALMPNWKDSQDLPL